MRRRTDYVSMTPGANRLRARDERHLRALALAMLLRVVLVARVPGVGSTLACNCSDISPEFICDVSVTTLAGTVAGYEDGTAARFNRPTALALMPDQSSALVTDFNNNVVRRVDLLTRDVSTLAGSGSLTHTVVALHKNAQACGEQWT
jgi:hypothetical protein